MERPLVTIVMPCYQCGGSVEKTVDSIVAQTVTDWELIAVDDGSRDNTGAVLDARAAQEKRLRVIHQQNAGVSAARNAGIQAAKGKWLFFMDADDVLEPFALCTLLKLADDSVDIVCGAYKIRHTDENNREEIHACANGDLQVILESLIRGDSALNSMCARLYRTSFVRENHLLAPVGVKIGEDVLFNLDAFKTARAWRMTDTVIYRYELGGNSAMMRAQADVFSLSLPMIEGIERFITLHHIETQLFRAHIDIYLRTLRLHRSRFHAALALKRQYTRRITAGVDPLALPLKQRLYYISLRVLPFLSILIP